MDDGITLRPPPVCTGRGERWLRKEWEPPTLRAALSDLHAPCLGASLMASCLSDVASRSRTSRVMQSVTIAVGSVSRISRGSSSRQRAFPRNVDFPLVYALSGCTRHCATLFHQGAWASRRAKGARPTVFYDLQNLQECAFSYSRARRQPYGFSAVTPSEVWVFLSSLGTQQMLISRREYDEVVSASHCWCRLS